jgi:hypothetical protein
MPKSDKSISEFAQPIPKPSELLDVALSRPTVTDPRETDAPEKERALAVTDTGLADRIEGFSSRTHDYVWSALTFAEQKAAFIFTADTAFLGYLLSSGALQVMTTRHARWDWRTYLALSAIVLLLGSIANALSAVMPRLGGNAAGLIYFNAVARRSKDEYLSDVMGSSRTELARGTLEHCHELARIARVKYNEIRLGAWLAIFGFAVGLIYIGSK